jgi:hypothetical protein
MKFLQLILMASISLFIVHNSNAQTAVGGCTTVTLTSVPSYPNNLIIAGGWSCSQCGGQCFDQLATSPPQFATTRSWLWKKESVTNPLASPWVKVQGGTGGIHGDNVVFNVSTHGTYRIENQRPVVLKNATCPNGRDVLNVLGQLVGKRGEFETSQAIPLLGIPSMPLQSTFSNEVVVGATVPSDITWNFVDANGNNLFNPGDQIRMNTTGTRNYEAWWLAVFENGGQNRYWSNGWQTGQIPSELNLNARCAFGQDFKQIPVSYTVQFAISANCNTSWTNLDRNFSICPAGFGCRVAEEDMISLYPNPANNTFQLLNIDPAKGQRVLLTDIAGRTVKSFDPIAQSEFDISDLSNGLYIVSVWEGEHRAFTTKLSVVK